MGNSDSRKNSVSATPVGKNADKSSIGDFLQELEAKLNDLRKERQEQADNGKQSPSSVNLTKGNAEDPDVRILQLEKDFNKALETISSLSDVVKCFASTIRSNRDDELHSKMDKILGKLENQDELQRKIDYLQNELERSQGYIAHFVESHELLKEKLTESGEKIDILRDEVFKVSEQVIKSKEINHLIDTAETSAGYLELFVKDFERIHTNIQEIEARFSHKCDEEPEKLDEITVTSKNWLEMKKQSRRELKQQGPKLQCRSCNNSLSNSLPFREDGVSVNCPKCDVCNIVKNVRKGQRWIWLDCSHFQQTSYGKRYGHKHTCRICGKEGTITEANSKIAKQSEVEVSQGDDKTASDQK